MMELLQVKNKGKIVLCNAGNFYIAIGKDAVLLNELLGLKLGCIKPEMCKVGFPISSLEKYIDKIQEKKNCYICSKDVKKYKKPDKYILALTKLYETEKEKEEEIEKLKEIKKRRIRWYKSKKKNKN